MSCRVSLTFCLPACLPVGPLTHLPVPWPQLGFPYRAAMGAPIAPTGGSYWWAGQPQIMPNSHYQVGAGYGRAR